jgi:hypothetical protein
MEKMNDFLIQDFMKVLSIILIPATLILVRESIMTPYPIITLQEKPTI